MRRRLRLSGIPRVGGEHRDGPARIAIVAIDVLARNPQGKRLVASVMRDYGMK